MKVLISLLSSISSFVIIVYTQLKVMIEYKGIQNSTPEFPVIYTVGMQTKLIVLFLALASIISIIFLIKESKYKLHKQVGLFLAVLAILLCFFPLHLITLD